MRSLSGTLLAAQAATTLRPAVACTLRPMSGMVDRLSFAQARTLTTLPVTNSHAIVAFGGLLYVYALDTTNGNISYRTVTAAGVESASNALTTVAAANNHLWAVALPGGGVGIMVFAAGTFAVTVLTFTSLTGGGATSTAVPFTSAAVTSGIPGALACSANGRLAIVGAGNNGASYFLLALAQTAVGTSWPALATQAGVFGPPVSMAAAYDGDWLLATVGTNVFDNSGLSELAVLGYGDGGQLAANTFGAGSPVVVTTPTAYSGTTFGGTTLSMGGACRCAQTKLALFETYTGSYTAAGGGAAGYTIVRAYLSSATTGPDWIAGNLREPQALPAGVAGAAQLSCDSTGRHWLLDGLNVWTAAPVATVDYSSRVLRASRVEAEHGGTASVLLDDSDGAITALAQDPATIGQQLVLNFGYLTSAGTAEYSAGPLCWVSSATCLWDGQRRTLELVGHDGAALLSAWRPRRAYAWLPGQSGLSGIVGYICGRAGLAYQPPPSPSVLLGEAPAFIVRAGSDGLRALMELLARAPECLKLTAAGATLVQPWLSIAPVYSYGVAGAHPVLSARATVHGQGANHVLVMGYGQSARIPQLLAETHDDADQYREGPLVQLERDMQLAGAFGINRATNAALRAASVLQKAQLVGDAGEIVTAPNVGLEIWDSVAVTCAALGWSAAKLLVREIRTVYARDHAAGGVYTQSVGLLPSAAGLRA